MHWLPVAAGLNWEALASFRWNNHSTASAYLCSLDQCRCVSAAAGQNADIGCKLLDGPSYPLFLPSRADGVINQAAYSPFAISCNSVIANSVSEF